MFSKIYLGLLAISVVVITTLIYLAYSQLQSVGFAPQEIVERFGNYDGLFRTFLWISAGVLLVLANIILWTRQNSWAMWTTFCYFAIFMLLETWWLTSHLVLYQKQNGLSDGSFQVGGIVAAFFLIIVGIGVFFDQFIVHRLYQKMHGKTIDDAELASEELQ